MEFAKSDLENLPYKIFAPMSSTSLCLIVTNECNLRCKYCFNYVRKNTERMSPGLAVSIVDLYIRFQRQLRKKHFCPQIIFFGGEPSLNDEAIFGVLEYLNRYRVDCVPRLVTNGVISDRLLSKFIEEKFYFQISFDGIHSYCRVDKSGACVNPIVVRTIEKVSEARLPIFLRATIHSENVTQMREIVKFAAAHNIDVVAFKTVDTEGNESTRNGIGRPTIEEYIENYFSALELALSLGVNFYSSEVNEYQRKTKSYPPPLVWFPDGHLAFTIKYASVLEHAADKVIVGKYSIEKEQIEFDCDKMETMAGNFLHNQRTHCLHCIAFDYCKGRRCFDIFAAVDNLEEYDAYSCDVTRQIIQGLNHHNLQYNQPF